MTIAQLDTENADRNITSVITVLTNTPDASNPMVCMGYIALGDGTKNLDGTGGAFELTITVGGQTVQPAAQAITFGAEVRSAVWTTPFPVPANAEVILRVKSPNAADTDVDVTAFLFDASAAGAAVGSVTGAVGSVTGAVGSVTGAVGSVGTGGITAASIATDAITSAEIAASAANKIADHVIRRNLTTALASSDGDTKTFRSLGGVGCKATSKVSITGSTLNVFEPDDVTVFNASTITTDSSAEPITSVDPA